MRTHLAALSLAAALLPAQQAAPRRPNVLLVMADDLGAQALGCYGNKAVRTPVLDKLAAEGLRFTRAYCQFPVCGPSRAAMMAGMYPQVMGIRGNGGARKIDEMLAGKQSLPQRFKDAGWHSARVGKIYHMRVPGDITAGVHGPDHAASWSERHSFFGPEWQSEGKHEHFSRERLRRTPDKHYGLGFGTAFYSVMLDGGGTEQHDHKAADKAIAILEAQRPGRPFFLALGFVRPHVPLVAPEKYYGAHPRRQMQPVAVPAGDWDDIPRLGISKNTRRSGLEPVARRRGVLQAYYASVAYMDAQLGRVLAALEASGQADNTIVVFCSDHGYHLGEHDFWQKMSLHEDSARIPLIIRGPGVKPGVSHSLCQQIDIYPTLCELAGLSIPSHVQGKSLRRVLADHGARVHRWVSCITGRGILLRSERWAYIFWRDGSSELYDMKADPGQFTNLRQRLTGGVGGRR